jgi:CHAT domain-containing protein
MEVLHISLKPLAQNKAELRYWRDKPSEYQDRKLAISEVEDIITLLKRDYYALRPQLQTIGQRLYEWLDAEGRWIASAIEECKTNTIVLAIAVEGKLSHLPWETLHDGSGYLVQKIHPLVVPVRWMNKAIEEKPPAPRPLQLLFMASSPLDVKPVLDFEKEESDILRIAENLPLTLRVEESGCVEELNHLWQLNEEDTFDVFHLSGHAALQWDEPHAPFFITENLTGERQNTSPEELHKVFRTRPPRLIFLSGCRTGESAQDGTIPSFAEKLIRQGMPAVMGWGRPVANESATKATTFLYGKLATGEPVASALGLTYQELSKGNVEGWHLLRLYARGTAWGALVKPPRFYRAPERVQSQFLDEDEKTIRVATPEEFVGRRRILQNALKAFKQSGKLGVMVHGLGGVGKSTVAARLLERLPEYQPIVISQGLDEARLERKISKQCVSERGLAILNGELPFMQRMSAFLAQGLNTPDQRFIFVLDDFEANLEPRGEEQVIKTDSVNIINGLLEALYQCKTPHQILITSRYDVRFAVLDNRIERIPLAALRGADLQKKYDRLEGFRKDGDRDETIQEKAKEIADGNPRLLEWLNKILLDEETDPYLILDAMANKSKKFLEDILAEKLLEQQCADVKQMLSRMQIYDLPVPYTGITAICKDISNLEQHCQRAMAVGLLENDCGSGKELYRLPRILMDLLAKITDKSIYQKGLDELYRELWNELESSEEHVIELRRIAELAHDYNPL